MFSVHLYRDSKYKHTTPNSYLDVINERMSTLYSSKENRIENNIKDIN